MIPRLYIEAPVEVGAAAPLTQAQAHYLKTVLRRSVGDRLRLFDGRNGEFDAELVELKKRGGVAAIRSQVRKQEAETNLTLCFAPVKRGPLEHIIQKATEIGVRRFQPVITDRTVISKLNIERLTAIAVEAAEQCGRMSVPSINEPKKLAALAKDWLPECRLIFCDETGGDEIADSDGAEFSAAPAIDALKSVDSQTDAWAVLTGPEGGFTLAERDMLREFDFVTPISLGPPDIAGGYCSACGAGVVAGDAWRLAALRSRIGDANAAWPLRGRRIERQDGGAPRRGRRD